MQDKTIFNNALNFGSQYIDKSLDRNVYPTDEALEGLKFFDEIMPTDSSNAVEVIEELNKFGSPVTVSQIGGRYLGFVIGGVVPTGLAAKLLGTFWDQVTAMYVNSPIAAKLENVVEQWLKSMFNLPEKTVVGFVSEYTL